MPEVTYEQRIVRKLREIAIGQEQGRNAHWTFSMLKHGRYGLADDFEEARLTEAYEDLVRACEHLVVEHWRLQDRPVGERQADATLAFKLALAMRQIALGIELGTGLGGHDGPNLDSHPVDPSKES